ncbi:hypothetical protein HGRIS_003003 [Hohenbuehelia grisea]|uniref:CoA-binding domain-containing protein n=1 Tax=Hohenbuehelia grisea TaxID=104357 RepID=A0ABR3JNJ2_9AGAR
MSTTKRTTFQQRFLESQQFAVVGASQDETKWATKVLKWYKDRHLDVIPIHPGEKELLGIRTVRSLGDLPNPSQTAISVTAVPHVALSILKQMRVLAIPLVWLQPGSEDETVIKYIKDNKLADRVLFGGPCVMKEGNEIIEGRYFEETYRGWSM